MFSIPQSLQEVFLWLARSSFYGTILLAMILLVRIVVKGKLRCRMVYWLWLVLLVRLIWPLNVQTAFSVFNLIPRQVTPEQYLSSPQTAEEHNANANVAASTDTTDALPPAASAETTGPETTTAAVDSVELASPAVATMDWPKLLSGLWLGGAGLLSVWVLANNFRLWRIIKRRRLVTRQDILELLEDCKGQLDLQTVVGVVETDEVKTPCLFGYLRPRLLLPTGILNEMTPDQLRYVFLHELAHLKRHDILIGWLMAVVQVLHWFNPAVWFAMSRINADRELACDELALSTLKEHEPKAYGATILAFLQRFAGQRTVPAMAGIAENQSLLKRRMSMIAKFKNQKASTIPILVVIAILAATTFTSARSVARPSVEKVVEPIVETTLTAAARPAPIGHDDGKSAGKKSIAGSGHAVYFEPEQKSEIVAVMLYGSRYGYPQPPKEKFHVWLCDVNQEVIADFELPYGTFKRGNPKWVKMRVKTTQLPDQFYLCFGFNAEQRKGVYVHYDAEASGNSYTGLPGQGFEEFDTGDWMIRPVIRPSSDTGAPDGMMPGMEAPGAGAPGMMAASADSSDLQAMINATKPGKTLTVPAGTYDKPIKITKPMNLVCMDHGDVIFNITANEPAIMIDTAGKGKVIVSGLYINWQLATSDRHEMPFAVAVKDTEATITDCKFRPLGNPQRSPVAIRSMGFSKMDVIDCDFTGFDYVVCYGEGTQGRMFDCFIRDCGHQGVILYNGAEATVERNVITGSKYHAVRTTGGKLTMKDNLIINNRNRGVYLGNKSGSGTITNNLLIGNASGIDGISACKFKVENNVILKSTYAAIAARPYSMLAVSNNVISSNPRGIIIHQEEGKSDPIRSKFGKNVFWKNQADLENCDSPDAVIVEPEFVEPGNGNFKLTAPDLEGMGLSDPKVIFDLWQDYKARR